jgi:hypothetical protein
MEDILQYDADFSLTTRDLITFWANIQSLLLTFNAQPNTHSFFKGREIPYVAQQQLSRNCFMLAGGTGMGYGHCVDHYEERYAMGDDLHLKTITVDLAKVIRHSASKDFLRKRVVDNRGGSTRETVKSLSQHCPDRSVEFISIKKSRGVDEAAEVLENHPIFIPHFVTNNHFRKARKLQVPPGHILQFDVDPETGEDIVGYLDLSEEVPGEHELIQRVATANGVSLPDNDTPSLVPVSSDSDSGTEPECEPDDGDGPDDVSKEEGLHSLVLISIHRQSQEGSGKKKDWFLIQNSWRNLALFTASQEYLVKRLSRNQETTPLFYIDGSMPYDLPQNIQAHEVLYLPTEFDDGGDKIEEDMEDE